MSHSQPSRRDHRIWLRIDNLHLAGQSTFRNQCSNSCSLLSRQDCKAFDMELTESWRLLTVASWFLKSVVNVEPNAYFHSHQREIL